jgi:sulfate/thiosulfate transport system permease protein
VSATALPSSAASRRRARLPSGTLGLGIGTLWLSIIVLLPLSAVVARAFDGGLGTFWDAVSNRQAVSALTFTVGVSLVAAAVNAVMGTLLAWVLVRDRFRGKGLVNAFVDLPFALPTIVAGLTLLALYGPRSPIGVNVAFTQFAVLLALLFVTMPFVVRAVQPVIIELDKEMEEAAASLGAPNHRIFRSIVLPNLVPAMVAGCGLAFARAIGEFGSLVLLTGNVPFKTEAASVYIYGRVQTSDYSGAAAVSVFLLAISVGLVIALNVFANWRSKHERT